MFVLLFLGFTPLEVKVVLKDKIKLFNKGVIFIRINSGFILIEYVVAAGKLVIIYNYY